MEPKNKQQRKTPAPKPDPNLLMRFGGPEVTLKEWNENPDLQTKLKAIMDMPVMKVAMSLALSMNPIRLIGFNPAFITANGIAISGLVSGYEAGLMNLKSLSLPIPPREESEPSYGATNPTE